MPKRKTRAELVVALRKLQNLIGSIEATYANDRQPNRADKMQALTQEAFWVAVNALATDPPEKGGATMTNREVVAVRVEIREVQS